MTPSTPRLSGQETVTPRPRRRRPLGLPSLIALGVLSLLFLLPFWLLLRNAFMTDAQIVSQEFSWLPSPWHPENVSELLRDPNVNILLGLRNSTIVSVTQTVVSILIASAAGYGLARIPSAARGFVLGLVLLTMTVPVVTLFIPQYVIVAKLGWINTYQGLIIPGLFSAFNTFMFRQFYLDFPKELEEAGRVDGLGWWGTYWYLALPNSRGMIAALGLLTFISSWNQFLWPLLIGQSAERWTVQVGISSLLTSQTVNLHLVFLASLIAILPLLLMFLLGQRWIVEGVKMSGSKG
ncbi:carbohydrate ABC transporter permease [Deinococcus sp. YIM 134068]|uniref:carbohydrate ABC transporter permease n=1 Tax=Deinococcus lichenicola TaxID=3118910 RepID=UPI002F951D91